MKRAPYLFGIVILSMLPLLSLFLTDRLPHTSDGAMHLARIASYYNEFTSGQVPVRWASSLNYGYGTPIFNFFHPLPYYITTILVALHFSLTATLKISFLISYLLSGIFMYLCSKSLFRDDKIAFWVTIFYQFAPFRLVDMLTRGSLGGIYSYTLLPLVLYGLSEYTKTNKFRFFLLTSLSSALLSESHNIVGFVFFGVAFFMAIFIGKSIKKISILFLSLFLGLGLASTFLIPAIVEHQYTYGYAFTKDLFYQHFPKLFMLLLPNFTNSASLRIAEVSVQIGIFHVVGICTAVFLLLKNKISSNIKMIFISTLVISFITILFMQQITTLFWEIIPILRQFQYPWRLLSVLTFTTALLSASILLLFPIIKKPFLFIPILLCVVFSTITYWNPPEGYDRIDESLYWNYPLTTNYFGEVDTIWSEGPAKEYPKNRIEIAAGSATVDHYNQEGITYTYTISASTPSTIVQRTQYFPGWTVKVDGKKTPIEFQDQNYRGLITFQVTKGIHTVITKFTQSKIQQGANIVSLITIGILILSTLYMVKKSRI